MSWRSWVFLICCLQIVLPSTVVLASKNLPAESPPALTILSPVLIVLGDSLSAGYGIEKNQGWVFLLQQRLKNQIYPYKVVNTSISGDTTSGALSRIDPILTQYHPAIVIIELGGNDGLRGLSLNQMRINLELMVKKISNVNAQILLVGMRIPPNYGRNYAKRFHAVFTDLANKYAIPLVPFLLENVANRADLMQEDRLHPQANAQPILLNNVWPYLELLLDKR